MFRNDVNVIIYGFIIDIYILGYGSGLDLKFMLIFVKFKYFILMYGEYWMFKCYK